MEEKLIQNVDVIEKASRYLSEKLDFSHVTVCKHTANWKCLLDFAKKKHVCVDFSDYESVRHAVSLFVLASEQDFEENRSLSHSLNILQEYVHSGKILCTFESTDFSGAIGSCMYEYISQKESENLRPSSLRTYEIQLSRFLKFLKDIPVDDVSNIDVSCIYRYIRALPVHHKSNAYIAVSIIKRFMKWLYECGMITGNISIMIPSGRYTQQSELPSVYSGEEIEQMIRSVDRSNPKGKRDYLILLLGARLGLRCSDICNLTFANLRWEENLIEMEQVKTARMVSLPLLPEVGNAVIDYLKYGRPKSDLPYVLLNMSEPYTKMRSGTISDIVRTAISQAKIDPGKRRQGAHVLRHSLAARMLESQTTMPVISEVLGHADTSSTLYYLRIDVTSLASCALEVSPVNESFYEQFKW